MNRREFLLRTGGLSVGALVPTAFRTREWVPVDRTEQAKFRQGIKFVEFADRYREELLSSVLPFWGEHSQDPEFGGYFSMLGRKGDVLSTDKYLWPLARQSWMFSSLFNQLERRESWLEHAASGVSFLKRYGRSPEGGWYKGVSREGVPLSPTSDFFSDCFVAMAMGQYSLAADDSVAAELARETIKRIVLTLPRPAKRMAGVKDDGAGFLELRHPMIAANVVMDLEWMLDSEDYERTLTMCFDQIFDVFLDPDRGLFHELVSSEGQIVDGPNGGLVCPGHGIEAMWLFMDAARRAGRQADVERAVDLILRSVEFGWDSEYGGILTYLDLGGSTPERRIWDRKRVWVHAETLTALIMGYRETRNPKCLEWFERIHDYAWERFPDREYGEWFDDLNRDGTLRSTDKGNQFGACYHLPRALFLCMRELEALAAAE